MPAKGRQKARGKGACAKGQQSLYCNIHRKRQRGGKPRKPGSKGAPSSAAFKRSAKTAVKRKS